MTAVQEEGIGHRDRLARHLAQPGAFAIASPLGCGRLALYRKVGGTSLGAGHVPAATAALLVAEGEAVWSDGEGTRRLVAMRGPAELNLKTRGPAEQNVTRRGPARRSLVEGSVEIDGRSQPVLIDERESPLLWLHRRKGRDGQPQISAEEFAAGERFRADLTLAQMLPRVTMNWDAAATPDQRSAGLRDPAAAGDSALSARQRVGLACDRLGPDLSGLAIDVCGFLKGLDQVERERSWPARSAKIVLRLALAALATHYGLVVRPAGATRRRSVWRAADARPVLMPGARGA